LQVWKDGKFGLNCRGGGGVWSAARSSASNASPKIHLHFFRLTEDSLRYFPFNGNVRIMPLNDPVIDLWPRNREIPPLAGEEAQVWLVYCDEKQELEPGKLIQVDQERLARFRNAKAARHFYNGRKVLRELLRVHTGIAPEDQQFSYGSNEKPFLPDCDIEFNVSHSGDFVIVGIGRDELGVDIEAANRRVNLEALARRFFAQREYAWWEARHFARDAFFQIWTHKESYLKATGQGISVELAGIDRSPWLEQKGQAEDWHSFSLQAPGVYEVAITCRPTIQSIRKFLWESD
jgi:4'-phosphopantetheinyl transferase